MEDKPIGCLGLAIGLRVSRCREPHLTVQIAQIIRELTSIEVSAVIKDNGPGDAETGDNVLPNESSDVYFWELSKQTKTECKENKRIQAFFVNTNLD